MKRLSCLGIRTAFLLLPVCLVRIESAYPCTCGGESDPCGSFRGATAIFIGRVINVRDTTDTVLMGSVRWGGKWVTFQILKAFKGSDTAYISLATGNGGGDCGYEFKQDEIYLVYAFQDKLGHLVTSICTRTRRTIDAAIDLEFLEHLPASGDQRHLWGTVYRRPGSPYYVQPWEGVTLRIVKDRWTFESRTDREGHFRFDELPFDTLQLQVVLPLHYVVQVERDLAVALAKSGCAEKRIYLVPDGQLSGKVFDSDGNPLSGLFVDVRSLEIPFLSSDELRSRESLTDSSGRYHIGQLPPGQYFVGINVASSPCASQPFPPTYYHPNGADTVATIIRLSLGERKSGLDLHLPHKLRLFPIEGFVRYSNGALIRKAMVSFVQSNGDFLYRNERADAWIDSVGHFSFPVIYGHRGVISVLAYSDTTVKGFWAKVPDRVEVNADSSFETLHLTVQLLPVPKKP